MREKIVVMLELYKKKLDSANEVNDHANGLIFQGAVMVLEILKIYAEEEKKINESDKDVL